jgi:hypothetical protein
MKFFRTAARNARVACELFSFFGGRRWWILPIVVTLFLLGAFLSRTVHLHDVLVIGFGLDGSMKVRI